MTTEIPSGAVAPQGTESTSQATAGDLPPKPVYSIFDKVAHREKQQAKPAPRLKRKAAVKTAPVSESAPVEDHDEDFKPEAEATKKPRRTRGKAAANRGTKKAKEPEAANEEPAADALPPSSSALQSIASMRTDVDPVTASAAPALLEPFSPVPADISTSRAEAAVVDLNHDRRKRQKMTPPLGGGGTWVTVEADENGMIINSSPATVRNSPERPRGSPRPNLARVEVDSSPKPVSGGDSQVGPAGPALTTSEDDELIPINGNPKSVGTMDDLESKGVPPNTVKVSSADESATPSSPSLPSPGGIAKGVNKEQTLALGTPKRVNKGVQTRYNKETHVFSIVNTPKSRQISPRTRYNKETCVFTILNSSPLYTGRYAKPADPVPAIAIPSTPPRRTNAFSLLGKKPKPADAEQVKDKDKAEKKEKAAKRKSPKSKARAKLNDVGNAEETIVHDSKTASSSISRKAPESTSVPVPAPEPKKAVHPFFNAEKRKNMIKAAKPVEADPKSQSEGDVSNAPEVAQPQPQPIFTNRNNLQNDRPLFTSNKVLKIPGLMEAPWPTYGTSHIRGLSPLPPPSTRTSSDVFKVGRKLKDRQTVVPAEEDILSRLARNLSIEGEKLDILSEDYASRKYFNVPREVRLPQRRVVTGSELQEMMRDRVTARLPHPNSMRNRSEPDSDSSEYEPPKQRIHSALSRLYTRLRKELTPFDKNECESIPWEAKYAPLNSAEVLQLGPEMRMMKDWLLELKTDKVSTGANAKTKAKKPVKKKRKKDDEMDGFVVTSEEEANIMDEITDPEDDEKDWLNPSPKGNKKSTVRVGDKTGMDLFGSKDKKKNTIVLSGPSGSGKTAAVYAVAKEMGYTVFEVSPGTRRNGKDVLDLVGDMSKNHLVHQAKPGATNDNPFAKAKRAETEDDDSAVRQQQSLILLEEVDILFEEDRTFWSAVTTLMSKSKRPIVLTCNDESLLPLDTLSLHAILRFSTPPEDFLANYLLLLCANEGHVLQREAVLDLVKSTGNDIRKSLMQLELYCQMGIGDRKGGLDWQLIRYPPGVDVARNGEKYRTISVDTYQKGMGWIDNAPTSGQENVWRGVWDDWDIDIGASVVGLESWAEHITGQEHQHLGLLAMHDFFEARSAADAFAGLSMSGTDKPRLDATQPLRNQKNQLDDPLGYTILQSDPFVIPDSVETEMSIYMRSAARSVLGSETAGFTTLEPVPRETVINAIVHRNDSTLSVWQYQEMFDPLSKMESMFASSPAPGHSCIYPSLRLLAVEVAPWVRTVLRGDVKREQERRRVSTLLSQGGKRRRTRASRLAGEGGDRARKERWFWGVGTDVLRASAGKDWEAAGDEVSGTENETVTGTSGASSPTHLENSPIEEIED